MIYWKPPSRRKPIKLKFLRWHKDLFGEHRLAVAVGRGKHLLRAGRGNRPMPAMTFG